METKNTKTLDGPVWAAILAAAIGCACLGLLVDLAEASKTCSRLLNFYSPVGDLSGKSSVSVAVWILAWITLHVSWRSKSLTSPRATAALSILLILLALVMTFPPFFTLLG